MQLSARIRKHGENILGFVGVALFVDITRIPVFVHTVLPYGLDLFQYCRHIGVVKLRFEPVRMLKDGA